MDLKNIAIILCAGKGSRMGRLINDKNLIDLNGKPVLLYSIEAFMRSRNVDKIIIVYKDNIQKDKIKKNIGNIAFKKHLSYIKGGKNRQFSVFNALKSIKESVGLVAIHDAARPLIKTKNINELITKASNKGNAINCKIAEETIHQKIIKNNRPSFYQNISRENVYKIETPQVFRYNELYKCYEKIFSDKKTITDESSALLYCNKEIFLHFNKFPNPKITTKNDIPYIRYLLNVIKK